MDVAKGGSWHSGFNIAGDIAEALVRGREDLFVDQFMRRETVGLFDPDAVSAADIAHYARALARLGALRCSFGYYRALAGDRDDALAWERTPLPMPVLAVGAAGGYGSASARTMRRVARDVRDVLIARCGHYPAEERPAELAARSSTTMQTRTFCEKLRWNSLRHGSILSKAGASGKPGAVHLARVALGCQEPGPMNGTSSAKPSA